MNRRITQFSDEVTRFDTGLLSRGIVQRRNDMYKAILHTDFDAQSTELAVRVFLQVIERLFNQVVRVRI